MRGCLTPLAVRSVARHVPGKLRLRGMHRTGVGLWLLRSRGKGQGTVKSERPQRSLLGGAVPKIPRRDTGVSPRKQEPVRPGAPSRRALRSSGRPQTHSSRSHQGRLYLGTSRAGVPAACTTQVQGPPGRKGHGHWMHHAKGSLSPRPHNTVALERPQDEATSPGNGSKVPRRGQTDPAEAMQTLPQKDES